jgi:hypothetical protein
VRGRVRTLKLSEYSSDTPASGWNSKSWTGRAAGGDGTGNTISGPEWIVGAGGVRGLKSAAGVGVVVAAAAGATYELLETRPRLDPAVVLTSRP